MTQTQNRVLDEIARLFTNAAGAAQGVRQEVETVIRSQAERLVADLDLVPREEFEVVRAMAALAREENEQLKARIEALEAALAAKPASRAKAAKAAPSEGETA
jgi:BMFP domain-containing protein YqiC